MLEGRVLLSHAKAALPASTPEIHVEATKSFSTISGNVIGHTAPAALFTTTATGFDGFSGHGSGKHVGTVYLGLQYRPTASPTSPETSLLFNGSAVFTTIYGEQIAVQYTGSTTETNAVNRNIVLTGTVNSGTGRFDGETGIFSATGKVNASGKFNLTYTISLDTPVR